MFLFIQKRLELKIVFVLTLVIAGMIAVYTYLDVKDIREDTIRPLSSPRWSTAI